MRCDANSANGKLTLLLLQTKEANRFKILVIGYLEISYWLYVDTFLWGKK